MLVGLKIQGNALDDLSSKSHAVRMFFDEYVKDGTALKDGDKTVWFLDIVPTGFVQNVIAKMKSYEGITVIGA